MLFSKRVIPIMNHRKFLFKGLFQKDSDWNSWEGGFSLGDVTNDGKINEQDLNQVTTQLHQNSSDADISRIIRLILKTWQFYPSQSGEKGRRFCFETTAVVERRWPTRKLKMSWRETRESNVEEICPICLKKTAKVLSWKLPPVEIVLNFLYKNRFEMGQVAFRSLQEVGPGTDNWSRSNLWREWTEKTETNSDASAQEGYMQSAVTRPAARL